MAALTDDLDLGGLRLAPGEGRRLELAVHVAPVLLGSERYSFEPDPLPVQLSLSRMAGSGYAMTLRFSATVNGPCMRCLQPAAPKVTVESREVDRPGGGPEMESPYVDVDELNLSGWARDALALALPAQIRCREDCLGLCPVCAADLNEAGPDHHHDAEPDPRWAKLGELRFD